MGTFEDLAQLSPEEREAENKRVWAIRTQTLVGRTIIGTLTSTTNRKGKMFKWNKSKCDTVKVSAEALEDVGNPKVGTTLKCVVSALGPGLNVVKSAWCAHPLTKGVEVVHFSEIGRML